MAMTHNDNFKPQGISGTTKITYENCDKSTMIVHKKEETGASRYFNVMDADGSATSTGVPTIIGSHMGWWKYSEDCVFDPDWLLWICPKGNIEIVNIGVRLPGMTEASNRVVFAPSTNIGTHTLWGDGVSGNRSCPFTGLLMQILFLSALNLDCVGVTGVSNRGWFFSFNKGSPSNFSFSLDQIPHGSPFVVLAFAYPSGTNFTITRTTWGSKISTINKTESLDTVGCSLRVTYFFQGFK